MFLSTLRTIAISAAATLLFAGSTFGQQNPREVFERARMLDESNQNLTEAIKLYGQVVSQANEQRALAARAQFRIGILYERLGRKAEAQRAFQTVVNQYADQSESVRRAQAKIVKSALPAKNNGALANAKSTNGFAIRQVWAGEGVDTEGSISADGRYLSFTDWDTGDLAVRDLAAGTNRRVTNKGTWAESDQFAEWSVFSPDGRQIAYAWYNQDGAYDLRIIARDGGRPRVLYRNDEVRHVQPEQWTSDGKSLLVRVALKSGPTQIAMLSVNDGSLRVLKSIAWALPEKMGLSPDGRFIAYQMPLDNSTKRDIFLLASDGTSETPLTNHAADDVFLGWSPDGRHILFASDRTGAMGVWKVGVAGGKPVGTPELIRRDVGRVWPLGFTAHGAYYFGVETGTVDVHLVSLDRATGRTVGSPVRVTERFAGSNTWPDFSPDGAFISYLSKRQTGPPFFQQIMTVQSLATGEARDLPTRLGYVTRARWSPDGHSLIVNARDQKNRQGLYRVDVKTGDSTTLVQAEPGAIVTSPRWSRDGQSFRYLYLDPPAKRMRLVERDVATGQESDVFSTTTLPPIQRLALSPSGDRIGFITHDLTARTTSLSVMSVPGGQVRALATTTFPATIMYGYDLLEWSRDGRFIYFVKKGDAAGQQVWRVVVDSGELTPIGLTITPFVLGIAVHPDGSRLAFAAGESKIEVWAMENFLPAAQNRNVSISRH